MEFVSCHAILHALFTWVYGPTKIADDQYKQTGTDSNLFHRVSTRDVMLHYLYDPQSKYQSLYWKPPSQILCSIFK